MFRCMKNITTLYIQPGNKQARSDGSQRQKTLALVVCHIRLIISQDIVSRNCFFAASANENSTKVTMDKQYLNYTPHWNLFRKRKQFIVMRSDNEMILSRSLHTSGSLRHNPAKSVAHWLPNGIMGHNLVDGKRRSNKSSSHFGRRNSRTKRNHRLSGAPLNLRSNSPWLHSVLSPKDYACLKNGKRAYGRIRTTIFFNRRSSYWTT